MSKSSDIAVIYNHGKDAMLLGMGALAVTNPRKFARVAGKILVHYGSQLYKDAGFLKELAKEEFIKPEVDYQKARLASAVRPGTIFTVNPVIPFILFGGILVQSINDLLWENGEVDGYGINNNENLF
jgi:hypothetical protein